MAAKALRESIKSQRRRRRIITVFNALRPVAFDTLVAGCSKRKIFTVQSSATDFRLIQQSLRFCAREGFSHISVKFLNVLMIEGPQHQDKLTC